MKVLLISDDKKNLEFLEKTLSENGCETIIYHSFFKALDNMQEISPDFCIISVSDYPRHWKVLAQFVKSGLLRNPCRIILFSKEELSEEESEKAKKLEISGTFENLEETGIKKLVSLLKSDLNNKNEDISGGGKDCGLPEKTRKKSLLARIEAMNDEKQKG